VKSGEDAGSGVVKLLNPLNQELRQVKMKALVN
jgi:hypothetical protein